MASQILELRPKLTLTRRQVIAAGAALVAAPSLASCSGTDMKAAKKIISGATGLVVAVLDWFIGEETTKTAVSSGGTRLSEFGMKNTSAQYYTEGAANVDLWFTKDYKDAAELAQEFQNGGKVMTTRRRQYIGTDTAQIPQIAPLSSTQYETVLHGRVNEPGFFLLKYQTELGTYTGVNGKPNIVIVRNA